MMDTNSTQDYRRRYHRRSFCLLESSDWKQVVLFTGSKNVPDSAETTKSVIEDNSFHDTFAKRKIHLVCSNPFEPSPRHWPPPVLAARLLSSRKGKRGKSIAVVLPSLLNVDRSILGEDHHRCGEHSCCETLQGTRSRSRTSTSWRRGWLSVYSRRFDETVAVAPSTSRGSSCAFTAFPGTCTKHGSRTCVPVLAADLTKELHHLCCRLRRPAVQRLRKMSNVVYSDFSSCRAQRC